MFQSFSTYIKTNDYPFRGEKLYNLILSKNLSDLSYNLYSKPKYQDKHKSQVSKQARINEINLRKIEKQNKSLLVRSHDPISLEIFKHLAEVCESLEIYLKIPETIIIGYGFPSPILLFTDDKGQLKLEKNLTSQHFLFIIELFEALRKNTQSKVVPLAIKRSNKDFSSKILMRPCEMINEWKNSYESNTVIQRFISGNGFKSSKISAGHKNKVFKFFNKARNDLSTEDPNKKFKFSMLNPSFSTSNKFQKLITKDSTFNLTQPSKKKEETAKKNSFFQINSSKKFEPKIPRKLEKIIETKKSASFGSFPVNANLSLTRNLTFQNYMLLCLNQPQPRPVNEILEDFRTAKVEDIELKIERSEIFFQDFFNSKLKEQFLVNTTDVQSLESFEIRSEFILRSTQTMINELTKALNHILLKHNKKIRKIVCDFSEDSNNSLYFVSLRAFEAAGFVPTCSNVKTSQIFNCPGNFCKDLGKKHLVRPDYSIMRKMIKGGADNGLAGISYLDKVNVCKDCFEGYSRKTRRRGNSVSEFKLKTFDNKEIAKILSDINPDNMEDTINANGMGNIGSLSTSCTKVVDCSLNKERE